MDENTFKQEIKRLHSLKGQISYYVGNSKKVKSTFLAEKIIDITDCLFIFA